MIGLGAALLCDAATTRDNLLHVLGGGLSMLVRPSFPAPLACDLALTLYAKTDGDDEVVHVIEARGRRVGGGDDLFGAGVELHVNSMPGVGPQSSSVVLFMANSAVPAPGMYEIVITVDGDPLATVPFTAVRADGDEGSPFS